MLRTAQTGRNRVSGLYWDWLTSLQSAGGVFMRKVGAFQAKAHFSELLNKVEAGEKITITRHGEPVAMIVPAHGAVQRENVELRLREIRRIRKGVRLGGLSVKALIAAGRKH